jgi:hypothetical protein
VSRLAALTAGLLLCLTLSRGQDTSRPDLQGTDSLSRGFARALREITSPELEERKALRRSLQQRGYATALQSSLEGDGLSALLAILRAHLQIALNIPHTPLTVHYLIKRPPGWPDLYYEVVLTDDWSFPDDPWRKP